LQILLLLSIYFQIVKMLNLLNIISLKVPKRPYHAFILYLCCICIIYAMIMIFTCTITIFTLALKSVVWTKQHYLFDQTVTYYTVFIIPNRVIYVYLIRNKLHCSDQLPSYHQNDSDAPETLIRFRHSNGYIHLYLCWTLSLYI